MKTNYFSYGFALILFILTTNLASASNIPDEVNKRQIINQMHSIRVPFILNKGQIKNDDVKFYAKTLSGMVYADEKGFLSYALPAEDNKLLSLREIFTDRKMKIKGLDPSPTSVNYFQGKDKHNWKTDIPSYNRISLGEVYDGIGVTLQVQGNTVEKLFNVMPQKDPKQIQIKLDGCEELVINEGGELEARTDIGTVIFTKPVAFQKINDKKKNVSVAYTIKEKNTYGFQIGNYDPTTPLIIDPLLAATFIGGESHEALSAITTDANGNVYVSGTTMSIDYPITVGVNSKEEPTIDIFISKLDSTLTHLLASTLVGKVDNLGGGGGSVSSIFVDPFGNVFISGDADAGTYPTTEDAIDKNSHIEDYANADRFFISKLSNDLSQLLASTFLGKFHSAGYTPQPLLDMDSAGNLLVAGYDDDDTYGKIGRIHNKLTKYLPGGYIDKDAVINYGWNGKGNVDSICAVKVGPLGNIYVAGTTNRSSEFTTTPGAYDTTKNCIDYDGRKFCHEEIFVSKFNNSLKEILATTLIGEQYTDRAISLSVDKKGNAFVVSLSKIDGDSEAKDNIVYKLNPNLSDLKASFSFRDYFGRRWEPTKYLSLATSSSGDVFIFKDHGSEIFKLDNNLNPLLTEADVFSYSCFCFDNSGNIFFRWNCARSKRNCYTRSI